MSSLNFGFINKVESGSTTASTSNGTYTDLITLSAITPKGGEIKIEFVDGYIFGTDTSSVVQVDFRILRDATTIAEPPILVEDLAGATNTIRLPSSCLNVTDFAPGTSSAVYKLQARIVSATSVGVSGVNMVAWQRAFF